MKNTLSKTESISNKSKDVLQNIQNTLSEIREDRTSTPEPISSRLRITKNILKTEGKKKTLKLKKLSLILPLLKKGIQLRGGTYYRRSNATRSC